MQQGKPYTEEQRTEIVARVCDELIDGATLVEICKPDDMPSRFTILKWLNDTESPLYTVYARARELQGDGLDDEMVYLNKRMLAGELDHNVVRVALNSMQWRAMRKNPRRYGDKLDATLHGDINVIVDKVTD